MEPTSTTSWTARVSPTLQIVKASVNYRFCLRSHGNCRYCIEIHSRVRIFHQRIFAVAAWQLKLLSCFRSQAFRFTSGATWCPSTVHRGWGDFIAISFRTQRAARRNKRYLPLLFGAFVWAMLTGSFSTDAHTARYRSIKDSGSRRWLTNSRRNFVPALVRSVMHRVGTFRCEYPWWSCVLGGDSAVILMKL